VVRFEIAPSGGVSEAEATPAPSEELARCVRETIRRWRFPAHNGQQHYLVRYPLVFRRW
jgi:hypothetical protein